jgi:hypothetical protein
MTLGHAEMQGTRQHDGKNNRNADGHVGSSIRAMKELQVKKIGHSDEGQDQARTL